MLSKAELRKLFKYDPRSGAFVYRETRGKFKAGQPAGSVQIVVSHRLKVGSKNYHLGPVIHRYMTGRKPRGVVDHKNGDRSDFRWTNLRDVSFHGNAVNSAAGPNKSGFVGVYYRSEINRVNPYCAKITHMGKQIHIGYYATAEEAGRAYLKRKRRLHGKYLRQARRG